MIVKSALAGMAVVVSLGADPALAAVCLDRSMTLGEIVDAINATPGCEGAIKLFEACELGSSGDIGLGAAVEKKCEADFLVRLKAPQRQAYRREMRVCDRKYENSPVRCTVRSPPFAGPRSPSVTRAGRLSRNDRPARAQAASAALAFSAIAWNATGSLMARSDSTLRSTVMPDLERPSINRL